MATRFPLLPPHIMHALTADYLRSLPVGSSVAKGQSIRMKFFKPTADSKTVSVWLYEYRARNRRFVETHWDVVTIPE